MLLLVRSMQNQSQCLLALSRSAFVEAPLAVHPSVARPVRTGLKKSLQVIGELTMLSAARRNITRPQAQHCTTTYSSTGDYIDEQKRANKIDMSHKCWSAIARYYMIPIRLHEIKIKESPASPSGCGTIFLQILRLPITLGTL